MHIRRDTRGVEGVHDARLRRCRHVDDDQPLPPRGDAGVRAIDEDGPHVFAEPDATDLNAPPIGPNKMRWPDREPYEGGYAEFFPAWERFWASDYVADTDVPPPAERDAFLARMAPDDEALSVRVR